MRLGIDVKRDDDKSGRRRIAAGPYPLNPLSTSGQGDLWWPPPHAYRAAIAGVWRAVCACRDVPWNVSLRIGERHIAIFCGRIISMVYKNGGTFDDIICVSGIYIRGYE